MKPRALAMMLVLLLPLAGLGRAQQQEPQPESLTLQAHCSCKAAPWLNNAPSTSNLTNVLKDFGTVGTYIGQGSTNRGKCSVACQNAAASWMSSPGALCSAFAQTNGGELGPFFSLGTSKPVWEPAPSAATYNTPALPSPGYPQACAGTLGYVEPDYYIASIVYAPPGCGNGTIGTGCVATSLSNATYTIGSTTGMTNSISNSVKAGISLSASASVTLPGPLPPVQVFAQTSTAGLAVTVAGGDSETITNTSGHTLVWPPGTTPISVDGVDNDFDIFEILLNPAVVINNLPFSQSAQWNMGYTGSSAFFSPAVQASFLRCALAMAGPYPLAPLPAGKTLPAPATFDNGSCKTTPALQMPGASQDYNADPSSYGGGGIPAGFLPGLSLFDYWQILQQDPVWMNNPGTNPGYPTTSNAPLPPGPRFTVGNFAPAYTGSFYTGSGTSCGPKLTNTGGITSAQTSTTSFKQDYMGSIKDTFGTSADGVSVTDTWDWTNETSSSQTNTTSQTQSLIVGCHSSGASWTGPQYVQTYYDWTYNTAVFVLTDLPFAGEKLLTGGVVTDPQAVPGVIVELKAGPADYFTSTDENGLFVFYTPLTTKLPLTATLVAGAGACTATETVSIGSSGYRIRLPPCATLTVDTNPTGLEASIGAGGPYAPAPISEKVPTNQTQDINVTSPQFVAATGTGYRFTGWSTGGSTPLTTVQPSSDFTATANFTVACYALTVDVLPSGSGNVSVNPPAGGLSGLPGNCYAPGTVVTLTATAGSGNVFQNWTGAAGTSNATSVTVKAALTVTANFAPAPVVTVFLQSRASGSGALAMGVENSGSTTATNVTVTAITGITATGATFVYNPGLLVVPFVIPGAASLTPGATSGFNLDFTATSGSAGTPFSFVITVKADNVPAFSTTIDVP